MNIPNTPFSSKTFFPVLEFGKQRCTKKEGMRCRAAICDVSFSFWVWLGLRTFTFTCALPYKQSMWKILLFLISGSHIIQIGNELFACIGESNGDAR